MLRQSGAEHSWHVFHKFDDDPSGKIDTMTRAMTRRSRPRDHDISRNAPDDIGHPLRRAVGRLHGTTTRAGAKQPNPGDIDERPSLDARFQHPAGHRFGTPHPFSVRREMMNGRYRDSMRIGRRPAGALQPEGWPSVRLPSSGSKRAGEINQYGYSPLLVKRAFFLFHSYDDPRR